MSEQNLLSGIANLLRPVSTDVFKGKGKLCLSTVYLNKLNKAFDENVPEELTSSFHPTEEKASLQKDLQFLFDLVKGTVALKVTPDLLEDLESTVVNVKRFQNIKLLEIHKIDIANVIGIQKLRSNIEELTCMYNLINLADILDKCGGDCSHKFNWAELKRANFSHNRLHTIDTSFECTPWLQILDLSHNCITNLDWIDHLPNLKRLNLSYNRLEKAPRFKGLICKRLQVLLLNNNFIEDISGLGTLCDLLQLDLAQNCLNDHVTLLSISQLPSLSSLDLRGNPINFHPLHRTVTCNYLNKNTAPLSFVLDNIPLTRTEKSLAGSLYPLNQGSLGSNGSYSSQNSLEHSVQERPRRVRNVPIQEGYDIVVKEKKLDVVVPSPRSTNRSHLDIKNKIEEFRRQHGENWMSYAAGEIFQEVLKFPEPSKASTSFKDYQPNLDTISCESEHPNSFVSAPDMVLNVDNPDTTNESFVTCSHEVNNGNDSVEDIFSNSQVEESTIEPPSDDEDFDQGEIFVGGTAPNSDDLCIVVTETHLSERDSVTSKEKARWHINVVKSCQKGENPNEVKIIFDTLRRDRSARNYYIEEAEKFVNLISEGMIKNKLPEIRIQYQCMKCNNSFSKTKKTSTVLDEVKVTCPKCDSNFVVESK
ncbi:unnamed protein product [Ceutorhynchus assimilis]|uniref:LKB1 serine/threonine kinase interacting protein 1 N-terminal domain-containing protein n=1 Tax=Ceutorhynchus assimilis TaxID=467358 RepID=A0A9N9QPS6_9CUCU|nr:unnamed protein product [Ceutorhynchus assimilis]